MIRKFLSCDLTKFLILTFVISRLEYCNSLLYGVSDYMIRTMQRVQTRAACLLLYQGTCNVNLLQNGFHWLPVEKRCKYQILCFVHRFQNDLSLPFYFSVTFFRYQQLDQYDLRMSREGKLTVRVTNKSYG